MTEHEALVEKVREAILQARDADGDLIAFASTFLTRDEAADRFARAALRVAAEAMAGVAEDRETEGECPARIRDEIASDIRTLGGVHD